MEFYGERPDVDLTYSDVFLVPRRSGVTSRLDVDLAPGDGTPATLPIVSANMNSVTGPRLAATLARRGGLGVLPQDMPLQDLDAAIRWVKAQPVAWDTPLVLPPEATVAEAARLLPATDGHGIVVAPEPTIARRPPHRRDPRHRPRDAPGHGASRRAISAISRAATPPRSTPTTSRAPRHAFDLIVAADAETVCVLHHGHLVGTLSRRSALRSNIYRPAVDDDGRLSVAAAVGINGDVAGKAQALAAAGVDVLVLDTAHGHQESMLAALRTVAGLGLGIPIAAGNIVTAEGVHDLVTAGADILKVGVGPGAMCTTRMMTAVGRPQFSAVLETAEAARIMGAHVWADGGVRYPRDVALALAAGAASVMIGSWFAGTIEAPGELQVDGSGPRLQGVVGHGLDEGRARALRPPRPVRARAQGAVRRGHLVVEDLPRPAAARCSRTSST